MSCGVIRDKCLALESDVQRVNVLRWEHVHKG